VSPYASFAPGQPGLPPRSSSRPDDGRRRRLGQVGSAFVWCSRSGARLAGPVAERTSGRRPLVRRYLRPPGSGFSTPSRCPSHAQTGMRPATLDRVGPEPSDRAEQSVGRPSWGPAVAEPPRTAPPRLHASAWCSAFGGNLTLLPNEPVLPDLPNLWMDSQRWSTRHKLPALF
jgi:hypothetical protein